MQEDLQRELEGIVEQLASEQSEMTAFLEQNLQELGDLAATLSSLVCEYANQMIQETQRLSAHHIEMIEKKSTEISNRQKQLAQVLGDIEKSVSQLK